MDTKMTKKAIYCDYHGVLNDPNKKSNESHLCFKIPQEACPDKIMLLLNLAIKHDAKLVLTSLLRNHGLDMYTIIGRCLSNSENEKHRDFIKNNLNKIIDLCMIAPTDDIHHRSDEIKEHIKEYGFTHYVVFEDEHDIDKSLNPIMCSPSEGLTKKEVSVAEGVLNRA